MCFTLDTVKLLFHSEGDFNYFRLYVSFFHYVILNKISCEAG